jgi:hypothetical protein
VMDKKLRGSQLRLPLFYLSNILLFKLIFNT